MQHATLTPALAAEWDEVVRGSPDGGQFALAAWQRAICAVEEWQMRDRSFAIRDGGRLLAVVPAQIRGRRLCSTGMGAAGPVIAAGAADREALVAAACADLRGIALSTGCRAIDIALPALSASALGTAHGVNPLVAHGFEDHSIHTQVVDLAATPDQLWAGLSADARQQVKRARAAGITVRRVAWDEALEDYYAIHCETYRRTGVGPHPHRYFAGIAASLGASGNAVLWRAAADGTAIAFHNCARFAGGASYWTGCSRTASLRSGVNYLLMWEAMLGAREDGSRHYEIGEVFPHLTSGKLHGLTVFKRKFGGTLRRAFAARLTLPAGHRRRLAREWLAASRRLAAAVLPESWR